MLIKCRLKSLTIIVHEVTRTSACDKDDIFLAISMINSDLIIYNIPRPAPELYHLPGTCCQTWHETGGNSWSRRSTVTRCSSTHRGQEGNEQQSLQCTWSQRSRDVQTTICSYAANCSDHSQYSTVSSKTNLSSVS